MKRILNAIRKIEHQEKLIQSNQNIIFMINKIIYEGLFYKLREKIIYIMFKFDFMKKLRWLHL